MPPTSVCASSQPRPQDVPTNNRGGSCRQATVCPADAGTSDESRQTSGKRAYPNKTTAQPKLRNKLAAGPGEPFMRSAHGRWLWVALSAALGLLTIGADLSGLLVLLWGVARTRGHRPGTGLHLLCGLLLGGLILAEGGVQSRQLHCQAIGFFAPLGESPRRECVAEELRAGRRARTHGTHVYNLRQRMQIHSLNLIMAAGGWLLGFGEVAEETAHLSLGGPIFPPLLTTKERLDRCRTGGESLETVKGDATFLLASPRVRQMVRAERRRLKGRGGKGEMRGRPQAIHWLDADSWLGVAQTESLRVALAVEVPDSTLQVSVREREGRVPRVGLTWTGTIRYPPDLGIRLGMANGPQWWLSEAILCGAQADGALAPFRLHLSTELPADDPRLRPDGLPRRRTIEAVFHRVAQFWPTLPRQVHR
jgi:hypothetical protein